MIKLSFEQKQDIGLKYVLDLCDPACPYGMKRLKTATFDLPADISELKHELDNISIIVDALEKTPDQINSIRHQLSTLKDITGSVENCENGDLTEIELFQLTAFLLRVKELIPLVEKLEGYTRLEGIYLTSVDKPLLVLDPNNTGKLSFYVEDTRTPELQRIRRRKRELESETRNGADKLTEKSINLTGEYSDERSLIIRDEERELNAIYMVMSDALRPMLPSLRANIDAVGRLDAVISKALLARRFNGTRPFIGGEFLLMEGATNPELIDALSLESREFTPITAKLPRGVTVLTGSNMGGKSIAIKTITLNVALALSGYFVYCNRAEIPAFTHADVINRDFSSMIGGLSGFGGEIKRFNETVEKLIDGGFSFIAMDEFARGTNAEEGSAIVQGVVKYLNDKKAITLLATHYDNAAFFAAKRYQVRGLRREEIDTARNIGLSHNKDVFAVAEFMDYGLVQVDNENECPRDAILICRLLGMNDEILKIIDETVDGM